MVSKIEAPLYMAGQTYFLSHKSGHPAKIIIEAVYRKINSKEWMYSVISEATNGKSVYISESELAKRISKHSSKVYRDPIVARRVDDGYRFAGNYDRATAISRGEIFADNSNIASVSLYPALDSDNNPIDGQYGIWIRWKCVITGQSTSESVIRIK